MNRMIIGIVLASSALAGCKDAGQTADEVVAVPLSKEERMQALFESIIDGVQLIESNDGVNKVTGDVDESTTPPSYTVAFEGCVGGFVGGSFCVRDGRHLIEVITPAIHIIRTVDQRYALESFGSVPEYALTGNLDSHVGVTVDTDAQTTVVEGTAIGDLQVSGDITGTVGVSLVVGGGRNYTESTATPIEVSGTLMHEGESYSVRGGFQRE